MLISQELERKQIEIDGAIQEHGSMAKDLHQEIKDWKLRYEELKKEVVETKVRERWCHNRLCSWRKWSS